MAKHIIEENIKTIGGQSIVGKGDIEISSAEVKVDNKTISKNEDGELQWGISKTIEDVGEEIEVQVVDSSNVVFDKVVKTLDVDGFSQVSTEGVKIRNKNEYTGFKLDLNKNGFNMFSEFRDVSISENYVRTTVNNPDGMEFVDISNLGISVGKVSFAEFGSTQTVYLTPHQLVYRSDYNNVDDNYRYLTFPKFLVENDNARRVIPVKLDNFLADEYGNIITNYNGRLQELESKEVKVDEKTISVNNIGEIKLGDELGKVKSNEDLEFIIERDDRSSNLTLGGGYANIFVYSPNTDSGIGVGDSGIRMSADSTASPERTTFHLQENSVVLNLKNQDEKEEFINIFSSGVINSLEVDGIDYTGKTVTMPWLEKYVTDNSGVVSFSDQFMRNAEGEKFIGIDGGEAYGQIAGLALKEFAGGAAKGVVIGNPKMLDGDYQGVISYFGDQENMQILNTMVTHVDNENNVISKGRTSVTSDSIGCDSGFNSEFKNGVFGLGGTIAESSFSSYTTKDESRATLTSQFKKGADVRASARIDANSTEETSKILTESESFEITDTKPGGKTYDVFEIFKLVENQALEIADLKQRIEALEQ
jgi:hypothetical protein